MAKFRQGNLVLQSSQLITNENGDSLVDGSGAAEFVSLDVSGTSSLGVLGAGTTTLTTLGVSGLSTLATLKFASGATIDEFSIDGTLIGDSDDAVPTEQAVKTYVDAQIGGTVPAGVHEAIVRYNGTNSVQDSNVFIDDFGNIDTTGDITCNDLYVSGDTLHIGDASIKENSGALWFLDDSDLVRFITGPSGSWVSGALAVTGALQLYEGGSAKWTINSTSDIFTLKTGAGTETAVQASPNGAVELYYNNIKTFQTNISGITVYDASGNDPQITFAGADVGVNGRIEFRDDGSLVMYDVINADNLIYAFALGTVALYYAGDLKFRTLNSGARVTGVLETDGIEATAVAFDIKTSGAEDGITINNGGAVELYYDNNIAFQTTVDGADIRDTSGANAKLNLSASNGTPMAVLQTTSNTTNDLWISATQSAGDIYLATQTSSVGVKVNDGGAVDIHYNGVKVAESTANGISGAVWG